MNILLVNDDGIFSKLLQGLATYLAPEHNIYIIAPLREQSGMSQALTLHRKLKIIKQTLNIGETLAYGIEGTPGDCVKIGLESLLKNINIDLVISGINNGYNLGTDIIYSGTVGAATEGFLHGVNSIAFSLAPNAVIPENTLFRISKDIAFKLLDKIKEQPFLCNVNFPPVLHDNYIYSITEQGIRCYEHEFHIHQISDEEMEYGIIGSAIDIPNKHSSDIAAINRGEISITPLKVNRTDFNTFKELEIVF